MQVVFYVQLYNTRCFYKKHTLASGWCFLSFCQIQPQMFLKCFLENDGQGDIVVEENVDGNIFDLFENFDI